MKRYNIHYSKFKKMKIMIELNKGAKELHKKVLDILVDPADKKSTLTLKNEILESKNGNKYSIEDKVPNLVYPETIGSDKEFNEQYEQMAGVYDVFSNFLFEMVYENEEEQRGNMVKELQVKKGDKILEVSCGTGLNAKHILKEVGKEGEVHLLDLSKHMLDEAIKKYLTEKNVFYYIGNGSHLPFKDNTFDGLFHIGGINTFTDIEAALKEFMRVTKKNGKIIICDEGMQENLLKTRYGRDGIRFNGLYKSTPPMDKIPANARDVTLKYVGGGFFYVISFVKGQEYEFNWDLEVPMSGGQTFREQLAEMKEKYGDIE